MALTHVADTSVLTRLHRPAVRAVIEPLAQHGSLGRPRICDLEIGFSARNARAWDDLIDAMGLFTPIDTTARHVTRALQVQRLLADRGQRGRKIPDLLIAAAAEERSAAVLHYDYDSDFDLIAAVTGQICQWVVPAGSVD